ncbi:hypothetical protein [Iodobacter fluviatilis]|uniref:Uncharacterized protein n=1 Tax=Iodobacter fluviatilis TaxID=537 RepID=A0A377Q5G0_9NEIS|nr:hypothetical protein [Iodobacter fluviatilis]TCU84529.1 hypothetical protein EV682_10954 [Iodobacter fluviatilis]STQ89995.1 Uncharacterised protein [Iodobacter fluviatilis]
MSEKDTLITFQLRVFDRKKTLTSKMIALAVLLIASGAQAAGLEPWHGKVLQIKVRHGGADWVARDVRSLVHASSENGNVQRAFVDVEYVSSTKRKITLTCAGKTLAEETVKPDFTGVLAGTCYGVQEQVFLVTPNKVRHPKPGTLEDLLLAGKK